MVCVSFNDTDFLDKNFMKNIILMADIVNIRANNSAIVMKHFKKMIKIINHFFENSIESPLTITLGDEFQCVVKTTKSAVEIIFFIEEYIVTNKVPFQLRFVINDGKIETKINTRRSYEMLGEGLTNARNDLNELKKSNSRFYFSVENVLICKIFNDSFKIYQAIIDNWNPKKDYSLITHFMEHKDYKKVAILLNKDKSQIWKRSKSLNIDSYFASKEIVLNTSQLIV
jgi:hypothetical protein